MRLNPPGQFQAPKFFALIAVAVTALAIWIAVVTTLAPRRLLTYLAFFIPFWVFVACAASAGIYWFAAGREYPPPRVLGNSAREGALIATVLTLNLALTAGHKWSVIVLLVSVALAMVVELILRAVDGVSTS